MLEVLPTDRVREAVGRLMAEGVVVAPVARDDRFVFEPLVDAADARLDAPQTVHAAKGAFFPSEEVILRFDLAAGTWEEVDGAGPRFVLGVHPCDTWGMRAFDAWMRDGIAEERYLRRRAAATIVAVRCLRKCGPESFCDTMGTFEARDEDALLTPLDGGYALEARTGRGEDLRALWRGLLRPAEEGERAALDRAIAGVAAAFSDRLVDLKGLPRALSTAHDSTWWQTMAERCLDCGQCVAVCPTCTCFGMEDRCDVGLTTCERVRCWDGCMFAPFAEVAGGYNFRRDRHARIRHRMNRKGNWLNIRHGTPFCTGCGRCVTNCPAAISPLRVFRRAQGEDIDV